MKMSRDKSGITITGAELLDKLGEIEKRLSRLEVAVNDLKNYPNQTYPQPAVPIYPRPWEGPWSTGTDSSIQNT